MNRYVCVGMALLNGAFCILNWPSPSIVGNAVFVGFFLHGALRE